MIVFINDSYDPYYNQAFEEYVFNVFNNDDLVIIWRNSPVVVVGCYQNICREVNIHALRKAGIPVIRRMSGGGTVYHDPGNVNYTMVCARDRFEGGFVNYEYFLERVVRALNNLGIPACHDRLCDIAIEGRKISGSAQKVSGGRVLHHGTLLFSSELALLDEITTKNKSNNFATSASESAICRVTNINEYFTPDGMTARKNTYDEDIFKYAVCKDNEIYNINTAMETQSTCKEHVKPDIEAFCEAFLLQLVREKTRYIRLESEHTEKIKLLADEKYKSWEWTWGKTPAFEFKSEGVFKNVPIEISYSAKKGIVSDFKITSSFIDRCKASSIFDGARFDPDVFEKNISLVLENVNDKAKSVDEVNADKETLMQLIM
jgi:Lipoate-protein ligase A